MRGVPFDYHGLKGEGNGHYTYQPEKDSMENQEIKDWSPTKDEPDYFGKDQLFGKYCCCKKDK